MSDLSTKAMQFAERMQNGPYVHLKDTRDLLTECAEHLDQKDALIAELVGALESSHKSLCVADYHIKRTQAGLFNPARNDAISKGESAITKAREAGHVRKD